MDSKPYLQLAKQVYKAFYMDEEQVELLALWLFINQSSEEHGHFLAGELFEETFAEALPKHPFSAPTWKYVLLMIYALDFAEFKPEIPFKKIHENYFSNAVKQWLVLFEKDIGPLSPREKGTLYQRIYKLSLLEQVLPSLQDIYPVFGNENNLLIVETQSNFSRIFEKMWQQFSLSLPNFATEEMKETLMIWSFQHAPLHQLLPKVTIYGKTNLPAMNMQQIGKILQYVLVNEANIVFTTDKEQADLIISTETSSSTVLISPFLTKKDIQTVKNYIQKLNNL